MALKIKEFQLPNGEIIENGYFRVQKIISANIDYEFFDKEQDEFEVMKWEVRNESTATFFIWPDETARQHRAQVIHWFTLNFVFNFESNENIYNQAYNALAKHYPSAERI